LDKTRKASLYSSSNKTDYVLVKFSSLTAIYKYFTSSILCSTCSWHLFRAPNQSLGCR
jgi:hypothetical protein